VLPIVFVS
jgi:hypothetical protein